MAGLDLQGSPAGILRLAMAAASLEGAAQAVVQLGLEVDRLRAEGSAKLLARATPPTRQAATASSTKRRAAAIRHAPARPAAASTQRMGTAGTR